MSSEVLNFGIIGNIWIRISLVLTLPYLTSIYLSQIDGYSWRQRT